MRFRGALNARDVVFERLVDLNGVVVAGPVDLEGADFRDRASFEGATFEGPVSLVAARFGDRTSFAGAAFRQAATFERALFTRGASLAGGSAGSFGGPADFGGAELGGESDFGGQRFLGPASFSGTVFGGRVSFALALFTAPARFEDCVVRSGAAFRVVQFLSDVSFARCRGEGAFELDGALFASGASFHNLAVAGPLVLRGARVADGDLNLGQLATTGLVMDVPLVETVRGPAVREAVLARIEATAQARGDLRTANDARHQFLLARARQATGARRVVDAVFYRAVGGYLVRPLHPLRRRGQRPEGEVPRAVPHELPGGPPRREVGRRGPRFEWGLDSVKAVGRLGDDLDVVVAPQDRVDSILPAGRAAAVPFVEKPDPESGKPVLWYLLVERSDGLFADALNDFLRASLEDGVYGDQYKAAFGRLPDYELLRTVIYS